MLPNNDETPEQSRIKGLLKRRRKKIEGAGVRGATALQKDALQIKDQVRQKTRAQVAQMSAEIAQILSGEQEAVVEQARSRAQERRVKRAQFSAMARKFRLRLRECDLLTPKIGDLLERADNAMGQDDLKAAANIFMDIARIVDPVVAARAHKNPRRDDLDAFFLHKF